MYISCPSCSTSFSVSGSDIGTSGQAVRCFNCGHTWHQYPIPPQAQAQYVPVQYVSPGQFQAPPQAISNAALPPQYIQSQEITEVKPPPSEVKPPPREAPIPELASESLVEADPDLAPEADQVSEPTESPEVTPNDGKDSKNVQSESETVEEDLPSDEELDAMLGPVDEEAVASILEENTNDETDDISVGELENLEDPEPIADIASEDSDDENIENIEPEDIPDPEPIVTSSFDSEPDEDEKKGGGLVKIIIWLLVILMIIGGAVAGAVYKRKMVVDLFPASNLVFEMIGLRVLIPGQGLRIKSDDPVREERDGKKMTIIKGVITNISNSVQQVPEILLQAVDNKGRIVLTKKVIPDKLTLAPGKFVKFTGEFNKIPKAAKRLDITYGAFVSDKGNKGDNAKVISPSREKSKKSAQSETIK